MTVIVRLFVILFGFLAACFVAGMVAVFALLFPEMTEFSADAVDPGSINLLIGLGFIVVSGFALVPALMLVLVTETFSIRHILSYAVAGGLAGLCSYLAFIPFDTEAMMFTGIVRRQLEVMVGSGILGGVVYWLIAGRRAGVWRRPVVPAQQP